MSCKSINPYELLGLTIKSTKKECKKKYYELALLCHPDKGGNKNDMIIIHNAYKYVMEQLKFQEDVKTFDDIEEDFKKYFNKNKKKPPSFYEIWSDTDEAKALMKFNRNFEQNNNIRSSNDPNQKGYGNNMLQSTYEVFISRYIDKYLREIKNLPIDIIKLIEEYIYGIQEIFSTDIVEYKEPLASNDDSHCIIDDGQGNINITDFTIYNSSFSGADYMKAMSKPEKRKKHEIQSKTFEELLEERKQFDSRIAEQNRNINIDLIGYGTDRQTNNNENILDRCVENIE